jgi:hypothetical protein
MKTIAQNVLEGGSMKTEQIHIKCTEENKERCKANGGATNHFENLNQYLDASIDVEDLGELKRLRKILFPYLKGDK